MNRCKDCKWFGEEIVTLDDEDFETNLPTGYHKCLVIEHVTTSETEYEKGKGAFVVDGSGYYAAIRVEKDFGCVKWEERRKG